jgi:hypothetical protein
MNTAKLIKETEKAIFVEFGTFVFEACVTMRAWLPKSQLTIKDKHDDKISFEIKNKWLLGAKVRDYAQYLAANGYNMCPELRNYLSVGRNEDIEYCFV